MLNGDKGVKLEFNKICDECSNCNKRLGAWTCSGLAVWAKDGCKTLSDRIRTERDTRLRRGMMLPCF